MKRKILVLVLVLLVGIQFIRPAQNKSAAEQTNDIATSLQVPENINQILHKACYDCHSNNTNYPWYAYTQPVAWWLDNHIEEGKAELNFSEFGSYKMKRKIKKLNEIAREVTDGKMPLDSYTWIHKEAKLSKEETNLIINWANEMAHQLQESSIQVALR